MLYFWNTNRGPKIQPFAQNGCISVETEASVMYFVMWNHSIPKYTTHSWKRDKYSHLRKWLYFWNTNRGPQKYSHLRKWLYSVETEASVMYFVMWNHSIPKYTTHSWKRDKYSHLRKWLYFWNTNRGPQKYIHLRKWLYFPIHIQCCSLP